MDRGSQLDKEDEADEEAEDEEEKEKEKEREEEEKRKAADIKSNNPHLAGGEKQLLNMAQSKQWISPLKVVMFHSYVNIYQRVKMDLTKTIW